MPTRSHSRLFEPALPESVCPANVKFQHWDVKTAVPEDLIGANELIHVRFLAFVLLNDEIEDVLGKLPLMLRPSGYLQWEEAPIEAMHIDNANPKNSTSEF
ncbi:uncharacterized protein PG986_011662 [Apiospora aurea]|uniref:Uncharacterized protein n=1 Tax=Apiospora aurea TaxID=335848 RepID=A0ABR1PY55_9PEZI